MCVCCVSVRVSCCVVVSVSAVARRVPLCVAMPGAVCVCIAINNGGGVVRVVVPRSIWQAETDRAHSCLQGVVTAIVVYGRVCVWLVVDLNGGVLKV